MTASASVSWALLTIISQLCSHEDSNCIDHRGGAEGIIGYSESDILEASTMALKPGYSLFVCLLFQYTGKKWSRSGI